MLTIGLIFATILETVVLNKIFMNNLIYDKDYDYLMTRQEFLMRRSNK